MTLLRLPTPPMTMILDVLSSLLALDAKGGVFELVGDGDVDISLIYLSIHL